MKRLVVGYNLSNVWRVIDADDTVARTESYLLRRTAFYDIGDIYRIVSDSELHTDSAETLLEVVIHL